MGYFRHMDNLYRNPDALTLPDKECYAIEKLDGTSSHIKWKDGKIHLFSGGAKFETFKELFDEDFIERGFRAQTLYDLSQTITVYGEAYGAKVQGLPHRYGDKLKFAAFEVQVGDRWLNVPDAEWFATYLGFEFVHYVKIPCTEAAFNAERDKPSTQAQRNGMGEQLSEGIIIRPLTERYREDGTRCIWKHKQDRVREMKTPRSLDPDKNKVLEDARAIAEEFVVEERLRHVMDALATSYGKTTEDLQIEDTPALIAEMLNDVNAECAGEFVRTKETDRAISKRAAVLFHAHLKSRISK